MVCHADNYDVMMKPLNRLLVDELPSRASMSASAWRACGASYLSRSCPNERLGVPQVGICAISSSG